MLWIKIVNDGTGTLQEGNYNVTIGINETVVFEGKIKSHDRSKGWEKLVCDVCMMIVCNKK